MGPTDRTARGVSDVMGYILIFGLILTLATTATTVGFAEINTQQQVEQISTVERGFAILDRDLETVQTHKDPKKLTPLNIQTGSLGYAEKVSVTIGARSGGSFTSENTSIETTPIRYQADGTTIIYEAGMLFTIPSSEAVLSRDTTGAVIGAQRATVPVVIVNPSNINRGLSPAGEIVIESDYASDTRTTAARTVRTDGDPLWIEITSPRAAGWETQLQADGFTNITRSGTVVRAEIATESRTPTTATLSPTTVQTELKD